MSRRRPLDLYPRGSLTEPSRARTPGPAGGDPAPHRSAFQIAAIYALLGGLWIFFSDRILVVRVDDPATAAWLQTLKEELFVVVTAAILYFLIRQRVALIRKSEAALRESAASFRRLAEDARDIVYRYRLSPSPAFEYMSPATTAITGYTPEEQYANPSLGLEIVHPDDRPHLEKQFRGDATFGEPLVLRWIRKDGKTIWVEQRNIPVRDDAGNVIAVEGIARDITERVQMEEQLRLSARLEAVGQLAGGIAHDFNNLLTAIKGNSELLLSDLGAGDPNRAEVEEIQKAADRAAALTRQLLAFSRKQVLQPRVLDLNAVVADVRQMLRRVIGEDVELATALDPALGRVRADPTQMEQILVNLAVNARDALPEGGKLTLGTANVELDEAYAATREVVRPGSYVKLSVSDNGFGMDRATQARIFEPFFTTKEKGKGTGLGLATVYGIVKQSGGYIWVYSEPGRGTTFKIYLPRVQAPAEPLPERAAGPAGPPRGHETILLVEDEASVRALAARVLRKQGYRVLEAADGEAARRQLESESTSVDLLLTDAILPGASGRELADRARAARPDLKVLFVSGYTDDVIARHGVLEAGVEFLEKPFTPEALARRVRDVLDARPES
ncbi:MAG: ATP-binding protein [Gemmatimonadota bacterium]